MRAALFLLLLLPSLAFGAQSNSFTNPHGTVSLISAANTATAGHLRLALRFQLAPGWHIYWSNPGDAGVPPQITLDPPAAAGPLSFPPPQFVLQNGVASYVLSGNVVLPFTTTGLGTGNTISATARWLVCRDICVPQHADFTLELTGGASAQATLFPPSSIAASPFTGHVAPTGTLAIAGLGPTQIRAAHFFPSTTGAIINAAPQTLGFNATGMTLQLTPGPKFTAASPLSGLLELTDSGGATQSLNLSATPGPSGTPLALWLGLAFLGGLLLNLMPCVFPVLALKAFGLIRLGDASRSAIRREALGYTAGVLAAMAVLAALLLAFRAGGAAVGWGFQFQSPVFVALLAWLLFCAGLSFAGAFTISLNLGQRILPRGSFFNGLLAVIVATPCTAPFMGGAIAAALAAPAIAAFGIFLCLGLGLAAPFLLLAAVPALARFLPRPGSWMPRLQQLLALPMFATALWMAWVMHREAGLPGLALLLLGALCLGIALSLRRLRPLAVLAVVPLLLLRPAPAGAALTLPGAQPYTPDRLAAFRAAGQPVLVDITAAWCITCLVNERTALTTPAVRAALAQTGTKLLVGDWTNRDPAITAYLAANNRDGVPLYILYPPRSGPKQLPQLLTPGLVEAAIR